MNSNQKFLSGVIVGAAAGAALALFFTSDKGKEVIADAKNTAEKLGNDIKTKLQSLEKDMKALLNKGKEDVADAEAEVAEAIS